MAIISVGTALKESNLFLKELGLFKQIQPKDLNENYDFPTKVSNISFAELGSLQLKLTAWLSYTLDILGTQEMELSSFETVYSIILNNKMLQYKKAMSDSKGAIPKEMIEAACINEDAELQKQTQNLITRRAIITKLNSQIKIYEKSLNALSREQSRRESEARLA